MPKKSNKKTSKKASAKKNKLNNLQQAHGKEERKTQPLTLDQIWGDTGLWKYNTTDVEEYTRQLNEMSLADIQNHASKMGIIPTAHRANLAKKLLSEFKKHVSQYTPIEVTKAKPGTVSKEARKILEEGQ